MHFLRLCLTAVLLGIASLGHATSPIMILVPSTSSVTVTPSAPGSVTYTLTNDTGTQTLTEITIEPAYGGGNAQDMSLSADTCTGSSLVPAASCTFDLTITSLNQPASFTLSPRVCAFNKLACSQAIAGNRPTVTVTGATSGPKAYIALNDGNPADSAVEPIQINDQTHLPLITGLDFSGVPLYVGIAVSKDGSTLYVSNDNSQTLDIFDITGTPTLTASIPLAPAQPEGIAVTDDKSTVYVMSFSPPWAYIVDVATQGITVNSTITPGVSATFSIALSPDQSKYYFADFIAGNIYGFNTSDNSPISPTPVYGTGANPFYVLVSPDNSVLYVVDLIAGTVYVLDALTFNLNNFFTPALGLAQSLTVSPDGSLLYLGTTNGLAIYETVGYTQVNTALLGTTLNAVSLDSTGKTLYGITWGGSTAYSLDTTSLLGVPVPISGPAANLSTKFIQ